MNPAERTLEVLRLRDGAWTIVAVCTGSETVRLEPFDATPLALGLLWADSPGSADTAPESPVLPDPLRPRLE